LFEDHQRFNTDQQRDEINNQIQLI
jgi:hypothetical protein